MHLVYKDKKIEYSERWKIDNCEIKGISPLYFDIALYRLANYVAVYARLLYRELEGSYVEARIISFRAF